MRQIYSKGHTGIIRQLSSLWTELQLQTTPVTYLAVGIGSPLSLHWSGLPMTLHSVFPRMEMEPKLRDASDIQLGIVARNQLLLSLLSTAGARKEFVGQFWQSKSIRENLLDAECATLLDELEDTSIPLAAIILSNWVCHTSCCEYVTNRSFPLWMHFVANSLLRSCC